MGGCGPDRPSDTHHNSTTRGFSMVVGPDEPILGLVRQPEAESAVDLGFVVRIGCGRHRVDVTERIEERLELCPAHPLVLAA